MAARAQPAAVGLKTVPLGKVGKLGLVHRDITGPAPRGPFDKSPAPSHDGDLSCPVEPRLPRRKPALVCEPDSQLLVRQGMEEQGDRSLVYRWPVLILNLDFTFGSQPLAIAFTERETIGGSRMAQRRCWLTSGFDYAFRDVWGNSTLGLLSLLVAFQSSAIQQGAV